MSLTALLEELRKEPSRYRHDSGRWVRLPVLVGLLVGMTLTACQLIPTNAQCLPWTEGSMDDLAIDGMQIIQVIEVGESIPLITGRPALVRVLLRTLDGDKPLAAPVDVFVHVTNSEGIDESVKAVGAACAPLTVDLDDLGSTYNAVVPENWIVGEVTIHATAVYSGDEAPGRQEIRYPQQGAHEYEVVVPPPFHITFVPITYGSIAARVEGVDASDYVLEWAWQRFPLDQFDAVYREPLVTQSVDGETWIEASVRVLGELRDLRTSDGSDRYYYGLLPLEAFYPGGGRGYFRQPVALGNDWNANGTLGSGLVSHELGHNFGLLHPPRCDGDTTDTDSAYPYERGMTGVYGYDWEHETLMLPTATTFMGTCPPWWISDYHYAKILNFRAAEAAASVEP